MPTREEKNTISNLYRLRSLEELEYNPKYQSHNNNRQSVFITKTIMEIVEDTQPPVDLWHGLWHHGHQWHAGLSRQHSPASAVAGISEGMCIPQGECRPIPCRNSAALGVAPSRGTCRLILMAGTLRVRTPQDYATQVLLP